MSGLKDSPKALGAPDKGEVSRLRDPPGSYAFRCSYLLLSSNTGLRAALIIQDTWNAFCQNVRSIQAYKLQDLLLVETASAGMSANQNRLFRFLSHVSVFRSQRYIKSKNLN